MKCKVLFIGLLFFASYAYAYNNTYAVIVGVADYKNDEYINDNIPHQNNREL